jgi:hypothetical protein
MYERMKAELAEEKARHKQAIAVAKAESSTTGALRARQQARRPPRRGTCAAAPPRRRVCSRPVARPAGPPSPLGPRLQALRQKFMIAKTEIEKKWRDYQAELQKAANALDSPAR